MSDLCNWLHQQLEDLPLLRYPFELSLLPRNGIYFFYEDGEHWGHGNKKPRLVRVGTSRDGNFRSRIAEHFLLSEAKMAFDHSRPAPHERSIFRKNIGRALLNRDKDPYLGVWEIDFTSSEHRMKYGYLRDIRKEIQVEEMITRLMREHFSFRFVAMEGESLRIGSKGLEGSLIGTISHCRLCRPSDVWLGNYSPVPKIRESGLWLVQHLGANPMTPWEQERLLKAVENRRTRP